MNIAFFSEDNFGLEVLKDVIKSHFVKVVVCPHFENNIHQRLESFCQKNNILFCRTKNINDEKVKNIISDNVDLIISCHCSKIIFKEIFTIPKFGAINLHPSLLPKYRGMSPQHWPIINADEKTGVTVHYIAENVDTGNILYQKEIPIEKIETVFELQRKMLPFYKEGISLALEKIQNGDKGIPQSSKKCIYYGKFYPEYAEISLRQTKKQVFDLVRAVTHPYCGATFSNIIVWKISYIDSAQEKILMAKKTKWGFFYLDDIYYLRLCDGILKVEDYSIYKSQYNRGNGMKEKLKELIVQSIKETQESTGNNFEIADEIVLLGENSVFDSFDFVTFVANLEEKIFNTFNKSISIVSEKAFSKKYSPFKTIDRIAIFIEELLGEE